MPPDTIKITGARQHNLQNIDVSIPRDQLVVITGLSGSGKSSLAFDTLFAEGQRKYVESLSAYARQFLDQMQKPDVDSIEGLSPAIAIEQRTAATNPRSTIATTTEVYDYLRLLYSAVGQPHDPKTGVPVTKQSPQQISDALLELPERSRVILVAPIIKGEVGEFRDVLEKLRREGFVRARIDGKILELESPTPIRLDKSQKHQIEAVIDRLVITHEVRSRLADSVETALKWGGQQLSALVQERSEDGGEAKWKEFKFSTQFCNPETGFSLPKLTPKHFSFNSHLGACPTCHGLGTEPRIDPELMIPNQEKTLADGAIKPWSTGNKRMQAFYKNLLKALADAYDVPMDVPYADVPPAFKVALCQGTGDKDIRIPAKANTVALKPFEGLIPQMERLYEQTDSEFTKKRIRSYMRRDVCETCDGQRLKPAILAITLSDSDSRQLNIQQITHLSIHDAYDFITNLALSDHELKIVSEVVREIKQRLGFLREVGLGYLTLDRESGTLSGGEAQRIRLATQIGARLTGVIYVLDEPSIGLHQRDNDRLLSTLRHLRDLGNSVIVVEHDEDTIRLADYVVDIGPGAGPRGGKVVAQGTLEEILKSETSLTARYLSGESTINVPKKRIPPATTRPIDPEQIRISLESGWLMLVGAQENNLRNIDVAFPLGCLTCVTGVSGSGKSTLVDDILRHAMSRKLHNTKQKPGAHKALFGSEQIDKVIVIDQSPIGRTPRSNPATYTGAFGPIRDLFTQLPASRVRGYDAGRFSFNVKGGRCENCKGDGMIKIEMHFLADVYVQCSVCQGRRYNRETLEITFKGRNIADVLEMTIDQAASFFRNVSLVSDKLDALLDVGLGYLHLGQQATTLSGGEAQRIKLATELARKATGRTLYIMDEPTTGLHFADIDNLMQVLYKLRNLGNSLIIIEHNLEVIKCADWVIDMGPEGGEKGGTIIAEGPPEAIAKSKQSHTGKYLSRML